MYDYKKNTRPSLVLWILFDIVASNFAPYWENFR